MEIWNIIKELGGYAGATVTIIGFLTMIIKPLREKFVGWVKKITNRDDITQKLNDLTELVEKNIRQNEEIQIENARTIEALKANLRNSILAIYNTRTKQGFMTTFEMRNLEELYENYKALGGNSFIHSCVEKLEQMEIRDE